MMVPPDDSDHIAIKQRGALRSRPRSPPNAANLPRSVKSLSSTFVERKRRFEILGALSFWSNEERWCLSEDRDRVSASNDSARSAAHFPLNSQTPLTESSRAQPGSTDEVVGRGGRSDGG